MQFAPWDMVWASCSVSMVRRGVRMEKKLGVLRSQVHLLWYCIKCQEHLLAAAFRSGAERKAAGERVWRRPWHQLPPLPLMSLPPLCVFHRMGIFNGSTGLQTNSSHGYVVLCCHSLIAQLLIPTGAPSPVSSKSSPTPLGRHHYWEHLTSRQHQVNPGNLTQSTSALAEVYPIPWWFTSSKFHVLAVKTNFVIHLGKLIIPITVACCFTPISLLPWFHDAPVSSTTRHGADENSALWFYNRSVFARGQLPRRARQIGGAEPSAIHPNGYRKMEDPSIFVGFLQWGIPKPQWGLILKF